MSAERIFIHNGNARAALMPAEGGALAGYWSEIGGRVIPWLRPAPPDAAKEDMPSRAACFPMVPFFGRVRDGRLALAVRTVQLTRNLPGVAHAVHGHGWQRAWHVTAAASHRVEIALRHAAADWPWDYDATQTVSLDDAGALTLELSVTNRSATPMPSGLGLHPYFPRTADATLRLSVGAMWASDADLMPVRRVAAPAALTQAGGTRIDALDLDHVFEGWDGRALLSWRDQGSLELVSEGSGGFVVIVARPGKATFQVEPVTHNTDAFNAAARGQSGTGTVWLTPGETHRLALRLRPMSA